MKYKEALNICAGLDIKVIDRKREFYGTDLENIDRQEEGWELEIIHNLTFEENGVIGDAEFPDNLQGVLICWDTKENKLNVFRYMY